MPKNLESKFRALRRRLQWVEFCRRLVAVLAASALVSLCFVVVSRLFVLPFGAREAIPWLAGTAGVVLIAWSWLGRIKTFEATARADEELGLKERLSSALLIGEARNEPELAVLHDAARKAESIRPSGVFKMSFDRELRWLVPSTAALALAWIFLPQFDLLAKVEKKAKEKTIAVEARKEAAKRLEELAKEIGKTEPIDKPEISRIVEKDLSVIAKQLTEHKIDRDQAMAKMAKLGDKLDRRRAELEKKLTQPTSLKSKGEGKWTGDLEKAIKKGNFKKAAKLMNELKEKLKNGELSPEEKAGLEKEIKMMAERLGKDSAVGEALAEAAEKMSRGEFKSALADLEMAEGEMMNLEAMLAEFKEIDSLKDDVNARNLALSGKPGVCAICEGETVGGYCEVHGMSAWKPGATDKFGNGMGGPGIGRGGVAAKQAGQVGMKKTKIKGQIDAGKIIAKMKVPGSQTPGEIGTEYEELRIEYSQQAEDTIENEVMPLEHKALIREYFDAIKRGDDASESESDSHADHDH